MFAAIAPAAALAVKAVAGAGVTKVVRDAVMNNSTVTTQAEKALVWVGTAAVTGTVVASTNDRIDHQFDDMKVRWAMLQVAREERKLAKKEKKESKKQES